MSHIVKGTVTVAYVNEQLLLQALNTLGQVQTDAQLYRVGVGYTNERYQIVLVSDKNPEFRIGFNREGDTWEQYQENYGAYGMWTKAVAGQIQDRYLAFHYKEQLISEGFNATIEQKPDGTLEVLATEQAW